LIAAYAALTLLSLKGKGRQHLHNHRKEKYPSGIDNIEEGEIEKSERMKRERKEKSSKLG